MKPRRYACLCVRVTDGLETLEATEQRSLGTTYICVVSAALEMLLLLQQLRTLWFYFAILAPEDS